MRNLTEVVPSILTFIDGSFIRSALNDYHYSYLDAKLHVTKISEVTKMVGGLTLADQQRTYLPDSCSVIVVLSFFKFSENTISSTPLENVCGTLEGGGHLC